MTRQRPAMLDLLRRIEETGGWDAILDLLAEGWSMRKIADRYGTDRVQLRRAMREFCDTNLIDQAIRDGAENAVEDAKDAMNEATPETAHLRRNQFDAALRLAGFLHKEKFGEAKPQTVVQLSIGDLHLQAVKQIAEERRKPIDAEFTEVKHLPAEASNGHHLLD